jgi:hypothetical protein
MATAAKLARGTQIRVETAPSSGTYVSIPEAKTITPPNPTSAEIDATNHDSTLGISEFLIGPIDPGECTFEMNYLPTNTYQIQLIADNLARTLRNYSIELPSPSTLKMRFAAYVKNVTRGFDQAGLMTLSVTLRCTGAVTEVP